MKKLFAFVVLMVSMLTALTAQAATVPNVLSQLPYTYGLGNFPAYQINQNNAYVLGYTDSSLAGAGGQTAMLWVAKNGSDSAICSQINPCLTVGHAISVATSGTTVSIAPGTYIENITLVAGVSLQGQQARSVFIRGNMTAAYTGTVYLHSVDLTAVSGSVLTISGASAVNLQLDDVRIDGLSGAADTVSYTNTNASTQFNSDNGVISCAVSTSAMAINVGASAAGSVIFEDVSVEILDNTDHVAIAVGGAVSFTHNGDQVRGQVTVANTAAYIGVNLKMVVTSVASLTTSSSTVSSLTNVTHFTTAFPLVTGAGLFSQGLNIFAGTGYDFANTLNAGAGASPIPASAIQLHASTLNAAGGLAAGSFDGLLEHDASHLYVDLGTTRYQLDQQILPAATTGSIGGGALGAGACTSGTVAVAGSTTAMSVVASPVTYPGDGMIWRGYVSTAGTVTVNVCSILAATPIASVYNVRVLP